MDAGLPRVEFETHGRIASAVGKTRGNRASSSKKQRISALQAQFHRPDRLKTDRLLGGLAACGKPPKDGVRLSIERLTTPAINGYGEQIYQPKGVCLVERRQERVCKGQVNRATGEIYARSGWRSVKTVIAAVTTRFNDWVMASAKKSSLSTNKAWIAEQRQALQHAFESQPGPEKLSWDAFRKAWATQQPAVESIQSPAEVYAGAARLAQERAHACARQTDLKWLGKQAVGQFWTACWSALAKEQEQPASPPCPETTQGNPVTKWFWSALQDALNRPRVESAPPPMPVKRSKPRPWWTDAGSIDPVLGF